MKPSNKCYDLIKKYEGLKLDAYLCPAGIWTIGYGSTGKDITKGLKWTKQQAEERLKADVDKFAFGVEKYVTVPLTQNQFDALVCFAYNVGLGNFGSSTLLKLLNKGNYQAAADQLPRWNKAGGKVLQGLTTRRNEERSLFMQR